MKHLGYLLWFILHFAFIGKSQEWEWANHFSFPGSEAKSVIGGTDNAGNLYCAVRSTAISANLFHTEYNLLKLDSKGKLVWSKDISAYSQAAMITDLSGNTFLAINDKMAKIDADGSFVWQKSNSAQRFFYALYLYNGKIMVSGVEQAGETFISEYDGDGNLISSINGYQAGQITLDPEKNLYVYTTDYPDSNNGNMGRLYKYFNNGQLLFKKSIPHEGKSIVADNEGSVFVAGVFGLGEVIDIEGKKISNLPGKNQFLIKYNSEGQLLWYKVIENVDGLIDMRLDDNGSLYYVTVYSGKTKINSEIINDFGAGLLLLKFDQAGNKLWQKKVEWTPPYNNYAEPEKCYIDAGYQLYISGRLKGAINFGVNNVTTAAEDYSEMFIAKLSQNNVVGVSETNHGDNFCHVFPNPSGDIFTITNSTSSSLTLTLTDVRGQFLRSETIFNQNQYNIDISTYPKGIYFLQIKAGDKIETKKLVKN